MLSTGQTNLRLTNEIYQIGCAFVLRVIGNTILELALSRLGIKDVGCLTIRNAGFRKETFVGKTRLILVYKFP